MIELDLPNCMEFLFEPWRFKVLWGGRGSGKSWSIARVLVILAYQKKLRILCARELQTSIRDSVHKLLSDQIADLGLEKYFYITENAIKCTRTGSEFFFRGIRHNAAELKSMEGLDLVWCEESQSISKESLDLLIPTVRKEGSEIWFSLNPLDAEDEVYRRFILDPPVNAKVIKVNYTENPFFPEVLDIERLECLRRDPESYSNIWEGEPRKISQASIFKPYDAVTGQGHYLIHEFDWCSAMGLSEVAESQMMLYHGMDFGFSQDPSILTRSFITGSDKEAELWIDAEVSGVGIEIDDLPALLDKIPTTRRWKIYGDCSRPETISFLAHQGFMIEGGEKWPHSVEDGIQHLRGFKTIHIHATNCPQTALEARKYSFKIAPNGDITPIILDAFNHAWDSVRYALGKFIKRRDVGSKWKKMLGD